MEKVYAIFLGEAGVFFSMTFAAIGSCYGIGKSATSIAGLGVAKPSLVMKSMIPVIMASVLTIYGLVVAILINNQISSDNYSFFRASLHLAAGMCVGFSSFFAGVVIGELGQAGVLAFGESPPFFVVLIFMLVFAEILALYGLLVGILLLNHDG